MPCMQAELLLILVAQRRNFDSDYIHSICTKSNVCDLARNLEKKREQHLINYNIIISYNNNQ